MTLSTSPHTATIPLESPPSVVKPYPFILDPPRELSPDYTPSDLVDKLRSELDVRTRRPKPEVWGTSDENFQSSAEIFNGAVKTHAIIVVKPLNAADVSTVIKFCKKYDLDVSVKAGGTGVHGWSIAGHVILDLALLNVISITTPTDATSLQQSFADLSVGRGSIDTASISSKRPSLSSVTTRSSESTTTSIKRDLSESNLDDLDYGQPKQNKQRMEGIAEENPRSSSNISKDVKDSGDDQDMSRSGSGTSGGSRAGSTPATSHSSHEPLKIPDASVNLPTALSSPADPSPSGSSSSSVGARSAPAGRMAYINPSPTTTSAFPFIPTTFGAGTASSISYNSSIASGFPGYMSRLILNTNPDPPPYTLVTFGAGVKSKQLDAATGNSPYGAFHVPTSAFPVGAGQFVLGGFGFIGRKHGLAMDNLVEAELVLADGRIVWVGEGGRHGGEWKDDEDPEELWWGLRGAGPSLGVITRFRARAYYLPSVYAGNLIYLFDKATTPSLLRHIRDCIKGAPRSLYTNIIMTAGPPGSPAIVVIQLCFSGPRSEGDIYIQAISSWEGGRCLFQDFSERTFERQQVAVEEVLKGGHGRKWYIKSDTLLSLSDEVIDQTCDRFHVVPDGCTWLFEYTGGGVSSEVKDSCFPPSHRESAFTVAALHQWGHTEPPPQDTRCVATAEDWVNEVIHSNSPGGPLPCFLQSAAAHEVAAVYGENWPRLQRLKQKFDPENMFRNAGWPRPGAEDDSAKSAYYTGQPHADGCPDENMSNGKRSLPNGPTAEGSHPVEGPPKQDKGKGKEVDGEKNIFERLASLHEPPAGIQTGGIGKAVDEDVPMTGPVEAAQDVPTGQRGSATVGAPVPGDS